MPEHPIPEKEQDNFVSVLWQLLREVESKTDPKTDPTNVCLVEGGYRLLNRTVFPNVKPRWKEC